MNQPTTDPNDWRSYKARRLAVISLSESWLFSNLPNDRVNFTRIEAIAFGLSRTESQYHKNLKKIIEHLVQLVLGPYDYRMRPSPDEH